MGKFDHVIAFFEFYGDQGPWPCYDNCGKEVIRQELLVHHINENHYDNHKENLTAIHRPCHAAVHKRGKPSHMLGKTHSQETRQKMSESHKIAHAEGRGPSHAPGRNEKIGAALRGRPGHKQTEETRKKIGESARQTRLKEKRTCEFCGMISNAGAIAKHKKRKHVATN